MPESPKEATQVPAPFSKVGTGGDAFIKDFGVNARSVKDVDPEPPFRQEEANSSAPEPAVSSTSAILQVTPEPVPASPVLPPPPPARPTPAPAVKVSTPSKE